ncbi:hypothetical protein FSP39_022501 [Pinctada imbricata]|uniref:Uncharacterized protein n=1 Tax=Pinctada imbricata TaxID=66713 RepID=A0AA89C8E9_PINIB|nr:hypothetical protein FSP39_022501 [Pinctada imbricata]
MTKNSKKKQKKGKKRKFETSSDTGSSGGENSSITVSGIFREVDQVLYGTPAKTTMDNPDVGSAQETQPAGVINAVAQVLTSTPKVTIQIPDDNEPLRYLVDKSDRLSEKLDFVIARLSKLDAIEERLNKFESSVMNLNTKVVDLEGKNVEFDKSLRFMSDKFDDFTTKIQDVGLIQKLRADCDDIQKKIKDVDKIEKLEKESLRQEDTIKHLRQSVSDLKDEKEKLNEKVVDLKWRSMKNNLLFFGIPGETKYEDTEGKLRYFLYNELGIERQVQFGNVHRFGRFTHGKDRPIVARFVYNDERSLVLENAFKLRNSHFGIREQFPPEMEDKRKDLYPIAQHFRGCGDRVKLVRDKLFVNGKLYESGGSMESGARHLQSGVRHLQSGASRIESGTNRSEAGGRRSESSRNEVRENDFSHTDRDSQMDFEQYHTQSRGSVSQQPNRSSNASAPRMNAGYTGRTQNYDSNRAYAQPGGNAAYNHRPRFASR